LSESEKKDMFSFGTAQSRNFRNSCLFSGTSRAQATASNCVEWAYAWESIINPRSAVCDEVKA
jgi:hypothetical protein